MSKGEWADGATVFVPDEREAYLPKCAAHASSPPPPSSLYTPPICHREKSPRLVLSLKRLLLSVCVCVSRVAFARVCVACCRRVAQCRGFGKDAKLIVAPLGSSGPDGVEVHQSLFPQV